MSKNRKLLAAALLATGIGMGFGGAFSIQAKSPPVTSPSLVELNAAFRQVAEHVEPSVVHIEVARKLQAAQNRLPDDLPERFRRFFEQLPEQNRDPGLEEDNVPQQFGNGSGWVYRHAEGKMFIITNNHVVENSDKITVRFFNKTNAEATVVGTDPKTDIAVLKVEKSDLVPSVLSQEPVRQGEIVFAFGSPFQFEFSMSQGIVSGMGRQLGILARQQGYENFIQTDAAINPGNSGGPLTNINGEVVGMNTAIASRTGASNGLGFAIPADMIRGVVDQIIENGRVHRGYLGVWIRDLDPRMAKTFGYEGKNGVLVNDMVDAQSPAAKAGMKRGDIIVRIDGRDISTADELRRRIASVRPDQDVKITVVRSGKELDLTVHLTELPGTAPVADSGRKSPPKEPEAAEVDAHLETLKRLGFEKLETYTQPLAEKQGQDFTHGILVVEVRPGSAAASEGFRPGIVITHVQDEPVKTIAALARRLAASNLSDGVRLSVRNENANQYLFLALPKNP